MINKHINKYIGLSLVALSASLLGASLITAILASGLFTYMLPPLPPSHYITICAYILALTALAIWLPIASCMCVFISMLLPTTLGYREIIDTLFLINLIFIICVAPTYIYFATACFVGFSLIDSLLALFYPEKQPHPIKSGLGTLLSIGILLITLIPGISSLGLQFALITGFSLSLRTMANTAMHINQDSVNTYPSSSTYLTWQEANSRVEDQGVLELPLSDLSVLTRL